MGNVVNILLRLRSFGGSNPPLSTTYNLILLIVKYFVGVIAFDVLSPLSVFYIQQYVCT